MPQITLKSYQQAALNALGAFARAAQKTGRPEGKRIISAGRCLSDDRRLLAGPIPILVPVPIAAASAKCFVPPPAFNGLLLRYFISLPAH